MEINAKVIQILDEQVIKSRSGEEYIKYSFVVETNEKYAKKICLTCIGKDRWDKLGIRVGFSYNLGVDVSSREWNGRWFTEASCWNAVALDNVTPSMTSTPTQAQSQVVSPQSPSVSKLSESAPSSDKQDDLPF